MLDLVRCLVTILFASRTKLAAENLALRHQLGVLGRSVKRPRFRKRDRIFWVWLSKLWPGWRTALVVVKPATVVAWHRKGFRLYWRWKSRRHGRHGGGGAPRHHDSRSSVPMSVLSNYSVCPMKLTVSFPVTRTVWS